MSAALRLAERYDAHEDAHENVVLFMATLLAPIYGRTVSMRREKAHGRIVTCSRDSTIAD